MRKNAVLKMLLKTSLGISGLFFLLLFPYYIASDIGAEITKDGLPTTPWWQYVLAVLGCSISWGVAIVIDDGQDQNQDKDKDKEKRNENYERIFSGRRIFWPGGEKR